GVDRLQAERSQGDAERVRAGVAAHEGVVGGQRAGGAGGEVDGTGVAGHGGVAGVERGDDDAEGRAARDAGRSADTEVRGRRCGDDRIRAAGDAAVADVD